MRKSTCYRTGSRRRNQEQHESLFYERKNIIPVVFPGCLRQRSSFRDQLVVPTALRKLIVHSCHDLPASGGHLVFKATFDKIRDRCW